MDIVAYRCADDMKEQLLRLKIKEIWEKLNAKKDINQKRRKVASKTFFLRHNSKNTKGISLGLLTHPYLHNRMKVWIKEQES